MKIILCAIVVFLLSAPLLPAQEAQKPRKQSDDRLAKFLKQFPGSDLNQDGELTREEVREFNRQRREDQAKKARPPRPEPTAADFAYGSHARQRFDIWAVPEATEKTPLVIFIHGGGFRGGDKKAFNPAAIDFYRKEGIAFATLNYRLSDVGPYPIMMNDCARALQTIRHHADKWNVDAKRIGCFGGSAGAGISLWLAFHDDMADPKSDDPIARQSTRIVAAGTSGGQSTYDLRTFRKWFGVPDLVPHEALIPLYGVKDDADWNSPRVIDLMEDASAINHLTADDNAPVYMTYNRGDVPVDKDTDANIWVHHYRLGVKLKEAMEKLGKECHVVSRDQDKSKWKYRDMQQFFVAKLTAKQPRQPASPSQSK